ncbi:accessory gene regulator B [Acetivibrio thermocellus AD2]|jgi:accessory gene regulator B|uniref:Accessory gene regulator B n=1 Tax=Acetivibrio thermocellus AD2 TaxID=1138384 RepID=A0AB36TE79_ACETH|nr:accessory gene regulator AgrB [Acetivibrio thermocellus]ADU74015.1 Accessory gene regulator B [Acetivibrio thermocellus DSM 1313]ALX07953.1 Accessory protein regulator B [Acetivibrio thermocellus AD2]ANV75699.1 Accessory regulator protein B [Acetivibrio thermocellus DSM 2360]EIC06151.1 Accessory gene regulator B [Acetivibrio thermocellus YS]NLU27950.1 accessory gene regulator AgrB [Acetivibrio thermocellus]
MPLLKKLCENITNVIKERVKDIDDEKAEIINYGLYLWIADIIKLAIIFTAACLLRVFKLAVVFVVCFGLLRVFAGGSHAKTFWGCLLTNSAITFGSVYLSLLLSSIKPIFLFMLVMPFCAVVLYLYAPADHENKPVVSKKQKRKLKIVAYMVLIAEYLISLSITQNTFSNVIILSTLFVCLGMLPVTYKIMGARHGNGL